MGDVTAAARDLVAKLELIEEHPRFRSVWTVARLHGALYDGPNYAAELAALKRALVGHAEAAQRLLLVRNVLYTRMPREIHADVLRAAADEIIAALRLHDLERGKASTSEHPQPVWLIERSDLAPAPQYYCKKPGSRHDWTPDPHLAMRFSSEAAAELDAGGAVHDPNVRIVEHQFGLSIPREENSR